ncbi:uncharacterized protein LOC126670118 [Mercurialis annua]|uniref:uncharacterized protein LOC126670118 n=1 Tax=Mercurialis annua TaxID=3986 RepID=UPI0021604CDC|nr:uncharacterized protein LOC126670118 [Mercurialis annua]
MNAKHVSVEKRNIPALQGMLSRNSSVCYSSRFFYCRNVAEGVPFQWEMQPGTPKDPPKSEILPPLSPPPAVVSLGFPKPCIHDMDQEEHFKFSIKSKLKFLKFIKKNFRRNKKGQEIIFNKNGIDDHNSKFESFEFSSSNDGDFMGSSRNSSFSSSSSSSSSSALSLSKSNSKDSIVHEINGCSPWNFNSILVFVAKRV